MMNATEEDILDIPAQVKVSVQVTDATASGHGRMRSSHGAEDVATVSWASVVRRSSLATG